MAARLPGASPRAQAADRYPVADPDLLVHLPCHCGCASFGHRSNLDCDAVARDGALVRRDPHGFGCDTCAEITRPNAAPKRGSRPGSALFGPG